MNLNIKKLTALSGVSLLAFLSTFQPLTNADAALTAPASYDYSFQYNSSIGAFNYTNPTGSGNTAIPNFLRFDSSGYYNYDHLLSIDGTSNPSNFSFPDGFDIRMKFNRSNTSWTLGYPVISGYYPTDTKIGSDSTVGSVNKLDFTFYNQTNKDYRLMIDFSSTGFNNNYQITYSTGVWYYMVGVFNTVVENSILIPAFSTVTIYRFNSTSTVYFDAWYLQDLGVADSYTQGINDGYDDAYDDGYAAGLGNNPNILLSGFQAMVGILVNFFLLILNLEVFNVSIMSVFSTLALFVGVIWFLKLVRG
jgi:hypothetical protein